MILCKALFQIFEASFGFFGGFAKSLQRHGVLAEVDTVFAFEFSGDVVDDGFIEVVAAEVCIAVGAEHFDEFIFDFEDGHVERAATEVEDADLFFLLLFQSVGECCRGGLVDDTSDFQSGDLTGIL